jgi:hypothetical protein
MLSKSERLIFKYCEERLAKAFFSGMQRFTTKILNPAGCRAIALPEAD